MHFTIATAGHIDHGKSALVQALTGTNPDRLPEEQARGISIELGFAHAQIDDVTMSFVDVPGHERFVRTMLAGVGGIDAMLLVVAADESVMPQTREHVAICRLLDVPAAVVALTKCDVADDTMQAVAFDDVRELLADTPFASAGIVRVSARTGEGLDALRASLRCLAAGRRARDVDAPARLPIDRVFTVKGFGTVVTGTLWSGAIVPDQTLRILPAPREVRVRGLQVHGAPANRAEAGQRVAVNLAGVTHQAIARGDTIAGSGAVVPSRRLAVDLQLLPDAPPVRHGSRLHVHLGTSVAIGRLLLPPAGDGPRTLDGGARALAVLRLETPLAARRGDRLVVRTYSPVATIGGARVVDPLPARRVGGTVLRALADASPIEWLQTQLREAGALGVPDEHLAARCGVTPDVMRALLQRLVRDQRCVAAGGHWVDVDALAPLRQTILETLDQAEASDPLANGVPRATLRAVGGRRTHLDVIDLVLARLRDEGLIQGDERIARGSVGDAGRNDADARVLVFIDASGLRGVTAQEIEAGNVGLDRKGLSAILGRLAKARAVERIGELYLAAGRLARLVEELRELARSGTAPALIEVGWFKDRYGLTRRTAIPLLEWLDRMRVTRREGDARVLIRAS